MRVGGRPSAAALGNALANPTPNPGAESQAVNPYANGISIPGTGPNGSATTFQDFWDPNTNSWAIRQGADPNSVAPIYTSSAWHDPKTQGLGLGSNESINGGQLTINNKGGGSTQVGYAVDPKTGYIVPVTSQGIGQSSWWQSTGIPIAGTIAALAAGGAGLAAAGAFGGAGALGAAGGLGAADAGAGLTAADLAGTTAGLGDLTSIAAPTFSVAGDAGLAAGGAAGGAALDSTGLGAAGMGSWGAATPAEISAPVADAGGYTSGLASYGAGDTSTLGSIANALQKNPKVIGQLGNAVNGLLGNGASGPMGNSSPSSQQLAQGLIQGYQGQDQTVGKGGYATAGVMPSSGLGSLATGANGMVQNYSDMKSANQQAQQTGQPLPYPGIA